MWLGRRDACASFSAFRGLFTCWKCFYQYDGSAANGAETCVGGGRLTCHSSYTKSGFDMCTMWFVGTGCLGDHCACSSLDVLSDTSFAVDCVNYLCEAATRAYHLQRTDHEVPSCKLSGHRFPAGVIKQMKSQHVCEESLFRDNTFIGRSWRNISRGFV